MAYLALHCVAIHVHVSHFRFLIDEPYLRLPCPFNILDISDNAINMANLGRELCNGTSAHLPSEFHAKL